MTLPLFFPACRYITQMIGISIHCTIAAPATNLQRGGKKKKKEKKMTYCDNQFDLWLRKSYKIGNKHGKSAHLETRKLPVFVLCVLAVMLVTQKETKKSVSHNSMWLKQSHVLQQVKQIQYVTSVVKHTNVCVVCICPVLLLFIFY